MWVRVPLLARIFHFVFCRFRRAPGRSTGIKHDVDSLGTLKGRTSCQHNCPSEESKVQYRVIRLFLNGLKWSWYLWNQKDIFWMFIPKPAFDYGHNKFFKTIKFVKRHIFERCVKCLPRDVTYTYIFVHPMQSSICTRNLNLQWLCKFLGDYNNIIFKLQHFFL